MEYRRIQGKSYMICHAKENDFGYELRMVLQNTIEGLVPFQLEQQDGMTGFWYDITGKNDLESYRKLHKLDGKFLEKLLDALQKLVENIGEYLLSENGISLYPEMIFLEYDKNRICFCYTPFEKRSFTERLKEFMEYFLQNMEHGSQEDIQRCYEVYEQVQKENICLVDILRSFQNRDSYRSEEVVMEQYPMISEEAEEESEGKEFLPKRLRSHRKGAFFTKPRWEKKWKPEERPFVFEPEEKSSEEVYATVFLGSETNEILGELRYEGEGSQKNMKISKTEFLIGKGPEEVDGKIESSTVSRIHAKIYKEGTSYYIEDLNSTNGTYKNGIMLNYKEKVLLEKNDNIRFAEELYRFV